jgi:DNA polymerase-3 subunit beta
MTQTPEKTAGTEAPESTEQKPQQEIEAAGDAASPRLTASQKELAPALALAARTAASKSPAPITGCVLVEAAPGRIILSATDTDLSCRVPVEASVEGEGAVAVPAKLLSDVVKTLPADAKIGLAVESGRLEVSDAGRSYAIRTHPARDFPKLPEGPGEGAAKVENASFAYCVARAAKVASKDQSRPALTGVLLTIARGVVQMVATDSYRLVIARAAAEVEGLGEDEVKNALVPAASLAEVVRVANARKAEKIEFELSENHALFSVGSATISARLIGANFPDYERLMPGSFAGELEFKAADLSAALSRVSIFASGTTPPTPVVLSYEGTTLEKALTIEAASSEVGEACEGLAATGASGSVEEGGIKMAFNPDYLAAGLAVQDSDELVLRVNEPLKPAVITAAGGHGESGEVTYLIMPMRDPKAKE